MANKAWNCTNNNLTGVNKMRKKAIIAVMILAIIGTAFMIINNRLNKILKTEKLQDIVINIYDKDSKIIRTEKLSTKETYLSDVLDKIDYIDIVTENGPYGEYITSIMGISQGEGYFWSYYINDAYASVGISNCKVENGKKYDFKIELFEN